MSNDHGDRDIRVDLETPDAGPRPNEADEAFDDRNLITARRLAALRPTLRAPTTYTQRLLERLDFLPKGGQRWRRDLQVLIPKSEELEADEDEWFIVSLGLFRRRRLPDFCVTDCSGRTLNLLTRVQHGHCLAYFTIDQFLYDDERDRIAEIVDPEKSKELSSAYWELYVHTFEMFTSVRKDLAPVAEGRLVDLLLILGVEPERARKRARIFMEDMTEVSEVTQYLCWVRARAGAPVRLTATYTMPDPVRFQVPDPGVGTGKFSRLRAGARLWSSELYGQLGLGPIFYDFRAPANDHAGSYYFTLEPPAETSIAYLDWGLENTIDGDGDEWACAHNSIHVHNGSGLRGPDQEPKEREEIPGAKVHAGMRLDPADHKQVLFAAVLNVIFVWLAEAGRLSSQVDTTTTPWLAFIPALLVAYVAQQRRHYFASSTRWIRGVIWGYLALNIVFLVSVTFDIASDNSFADRNGVSDDIVSIAMAAASIVVFCVFSFIGLPYERVVKRFFKRVRRRIARSAPSAKVEDTVHTYARVARRYGHVAVATTLVLLGLMAGVILTGNGPNPPAATASPEAKASPKAQAGGKGSRPDPRPNKGSPPMAASER